MLVATLSFSSIILIHDTKKQEIHSKKYDYLYRNRPYEGFFSRQQSIYKTYIVYFCLQSQSRFIIRIFTFISSMTYRIGIKSPSRRKPKYKTEIRKIKFSNPFHIMPVSLFLYGNIESIILLFEASNPNSLNGKALKA